MEQWGRETINLFLNGGWKCVLCTHNLHTYLCACILYIGTRKPGQDARWDISFLVKPTAE